MSGNHFQARIKSYHLAMYGVPGSFDAIILEA